MLLPHLKPGKTFDVVLDNSLALIRAGWTKGEAMAISLRAAGYRPPRQKPSSSVVH